MKFRFVCLCLTAGKGFGGLPIGNLEDDKVLDADFDDLDLNYIGNNELGKKLEVHEWTKKKENYKEVCQVQEEFRR